MTHNERRLLLFIGEVMEAQLLRQAAEHQDPGAFSRAEVLKRLMEPVARFQRLEAAASVEHVDAVAAYARRAHERGE